MLMLSAGVYWYLKREIFSIIAHLIRIYFLPYIYSIHNSFSPTISYSFFIYLFAEHSEPYIIYTIDWASSALLSHYVRILYTRESRHIHDMKKSKHEKFTSVKNNIYYSPGVYFFLSHKYLYMYNFLFL